jgi:hypothetical protein
LSETFLIVRRIERDIIVSVNRISCEIPVILVRFLRKLEFYQHIFRKNTHISMWMDGQTDITKLIIAFRNFANVPTKFMMYVNVAVIR